MSSKQINNKFHNSAIVKKLFYNVIFVLILSNLVGAITNFTDGICASRFVNDAASAGLAVVSPLITFVSIINNIIQIGAQIYVSRQLAKGDFKGAKKTFSTSIAMSALSGVILSIIVIPICSNGNMLWLLGADSFSFKYAFWYVVGFFIGVPFYIAYNVLLPLTNLVNGKKISTISIFAVLFVNVIGDVVSGVLFKYGPHATDIDFGKWAIFGIAIATSLSFVVGTIILSFAFFNKKSTLKFSFKSISLDTAGKVSLIGLPAGIKVLFIFLRTSTINILFSNAASLTNQMQYDPRVLFTALSAQSHITPFVESITGGLIATSLSLSSIFYAEEDEDSLNELLKLVIKSSLIVVTIFSVIYALLSGPLVWLYGVGETTEEEPDLAKAMIEQSRIALICDALATPFVTLNASFLAFFQGTRKTKYAYIVTCLQSLVLPLASVAIFIFLASFNGDVWAGISFGFVSYTFIHLIFALFYALAHKQRFRIDVRSLFFLPKDFGCPIDNQLTFVVRGITDVFPLPEKIIDFCKKHQIDSRRTYHIAACTEELAKSIIVSGFPTEPKRKHTIEIRIVYKNDDIILRIRDDCSKYNIEDRATRLSLKNDPVANVSMRIVYKSVKEIQYSNLLKTNNLYVKI
ncbi:MAG: hypothetical protein MJ214_02875 [Bacilli bacterium]|nr:hypothetical protein [Bacilli bacterium]